MKYTCVIYGLKGKKEKTFDTYNQAFDYGTRYIIDVDWTASFKVKEKRK